MNRVIIQRRQDDLVLVESYFNVSDRIEYGSDMTEQK